MKNLLDALDYDWEAHFREVLGETLGSAAFTFFHHTLGQRSPAR